jgi:hypothetical protein
MKRAIVVVAALLTACGAAPTDVQEPDSGLPIPDAGQTPAQDAAVAQDSGFANPDSGTPIADSGADPDAGPTPDAGATPDAGSRPDAGSTPDAGAPCGAQGETCCANSACNSGLQCNLYSSIAPNDTCQPTGAQGEPCLYTVPPQGLIQFSCNTGITCDNDGWSNETNSCSTWGYEDGLCGTGNSCLGGRLCMTSAGGSASHDFCVTITGGTVNCATGSTTAGTYGHSAVGYTRPDGGFSELCCPGLSPSGGTCS